MGFNPNAAEDAREFAHDNPDFDGLTAEDFPEEAEGEEDPFAWEGESQAPEDDVTEAPGWWMADSEDEPPF